LIPFCHPIALTSCEIQITPAADALHIECAVEADDRTGVEMEALTGANIAALTVYDMCKALSHDIVIEEVRLLEKRGGRHDVTPGAR
jgi:cyclic pyranopterin phosphate synthase